LRAPAVARWPRALTAPCVASTSRETPSSWIFDLLIGHEAAPR
jgi:hypothetical protein